jgi:peptidoglycan/LPS O-acetylase OafA/YrhL
MLRSVGAVAAGYLVFAALGVLLFQLSGQPAHAPASTAFKVLAIGWGAAAAAVAGWVAARLAPRRPAAHAAVLSGVIALGAAVSLATSPPGAIWSQVSALLVMAPCAWLGGRRQAP